MENSVQISDQGNSVAQFNNSFQNENRKWLSKEEMIDLTNQNAFFGREPIEFAEIVDKGKIGLY